eukprot:11221157-Lingulodinium_polyedra.AAC.1
MLCGPAIRRNVQCITNAVSVTKPARAFIVGVCVAANPNGVAQANAVPRRNYIAQRGARLSSPTA